MLRRPVVLVAALFLLVVPVVVASADGVTEVSDTLSVIKEGDAPSNAEVAVTLSEATPLTPTRVLIGRDDVFVDSMTSGVLQSASPLLLVPPEGPVPDLVMDELTRLAPGRVTLLGGEAAVQPAVADQLADAGYAVDRRAGNSRFETAIEIAEDAPPATTAILTRAFAHPDATDDTQAFADSLAAGGMAAENGWPILLTQTDVLSGPTADYMAGKDYDRVLIMGGTAAISQAVEDAVRALGVPTVERISGPNRFGTGIEVAKELGADSAADVDRVTLVDGQAANAWAGGFAAAAHSAFFDAPIVLGTGDTLPAETAEWLAGDGPAFAGPQSLIRITCVVSSVVCERARQVLGLPAVVPVTFTPPTGSTVAPGSSVVIDTSGSPATVQGGSCVSGQGGPLAADGIVQISMGAPGTQCELVITLDLPGGRTQTETARYTFGQRSVTVALVSRDAQGDAVGGGFPDITDGGSTIVFVSDGDPLGLGTPGHHVYMFSDQLSLVDRRPNGDPADGHLTYGAAQRPVISGDGRFVVFNSPDPALDHQGGQGTTTDNAYLFDVTTGQTQLLSIDANGDPVGTPMFADVANDGSVAVYVGSGVGPTGTDSRQVFIRDLMSGSIDVVTDHNGDPFLNADVVAMDLSSDGSTLAFDSYRADLIPSDTNALPDTFAYDLLAATIERVSVSDEAGAEPTGDSNSSAQRGIALTADGQQVAFISGANNLAGDGQLASPDLFVRDRPAGRTLLISRADDQSTQLDDAHFPDVSSDGSYFTYYSVQIPFGSQVQAIGCAVYRVDPTGGATRVDLRADGTPPAAANCGPGRSAVSTTGIVVFGHQRGLVERDTNNAGDVYVALTS